MSGHLTTAVVDIARGVPAGGMLIDLFRLSRSMGERNHVKTVETNNLGTTDLPLLAGDEFVVAIYEMLFHVGRYFKLQRLILDDSPFFDVVPVRFTITDPQRGLHVPLLASPWSYTTYCT